MSAARLVPVLFACLAPMGGKSVADGAPAMPPCAASGEFTPICGVQAPEDLELLQNGRHVLVSQGRGPTHLEDSNLAVLDLTAGTLRVLPVDVDPMAGWGEASCRAPDEQLSVHGIHLSTRAAGERQLLVVNHGSRESVEYYELHGEASGKLEEYGLKWRGCVITPGGVMFNDVAALPSGFVATIMGETKHFAGNDGLDFLLSGQNTGQVVEWSAESGFTPLPHTERPFPNGVQTSSDARYVYFAAWTGRKVVRYDRHSGEIAELALDFHPDNLSWTAQGTLVTAGITDTQSLRQCLAIGSPFCGGAFRVAEIDPAAWRATSLIEGAADVVGGASVALRIDDVIYIGAFSGDRIARARLEAD